MAIRLTSAIVVHDIDLVRDDEHARLSCRLRAPGVDLPPSLWFEVPSGLAHALSPNGDPFLPPLLLRCMQERRRLIVEDSVSATLLQATPRIMRTFADWSRDQDSVLEPVTIEAPALPRAERGNATAACFSGGVDSSYTLMRNHTRYPPSDSRAITHLLLIHGLDIRLDDRALFDQMLSAAGEIAARTGKALVPVRTNVREVLAGIDWAVYAHGPALAAVGLALSRLFHTVFLAAGLSYEEVYPNGIHPSLDPLWSTETTEFVHDGAELNRSEKIAFLARFPVALAFLRVCWENRGDAYNCGACEKCVRTMLDLHVVGALPQARALPSRIDPALIDRIALTPHGARFWQGLPARLRAAGRDEELARAVGRALEGAAWTASRLGRLDATLWAVLGRMGIRPARVKALDERVLGGAGVRVFHRLRRWLVGRTPW